jgi:hypothetical protein
MSTRRRFAAVAAAIGALALAAPATHAKAATPPAAPDTTAITNALTGAMNAYQKEANSYRTQATDAINAAEKTYRTNAADAAKAYRTAEKTYRTNATDAIRGVRTNAVSLLNSWATAAQRLVGTPPA